MGGEKPSTSLALEIEIRNKRTVVFPSSTSLVPGQWMQRITTSCLESKDRSEVRDEVSHHSSVKMKKTLVGLVI